MQKRVLILGGSGMLGNALFRLFSEGEGFCTIASVRNPGSVARLPSALRSNIEVGVNSDDMDSLARILDKHRPNVVINCIGLVKQLSDVKDPLVALPINSIFPHRLARLCALIDARLIHISTDCVFDGGKGGYAEKDVPNATDLYGRSKLLGEVDYPNTITLRTSIIGHELSTAHGLVEWFLSQSGRVQGFSKAVFSGLPTVSLGKVIRDFVIPAPELTGLFHVSAAPISKHDLLTLVAERYGKSIEIVPCDQPVIDRSLDSTRFQRTTGYKPPSWSDLVDEMKRFG